MTKEVVWSVLIECRRCVVGVVYRLELSMFCVKKFGPIRKFDGSV
jgi:hypothetical protein